MVQSTATVSMIYAHDAMRSQHDLFSVIALLLPYLECASLVEDFPAGMRGNRHDERFSPVECGSSTGWLDLCVTMLL